ncbi:MAG TPA: alkaline phosphatase family protein, partial [Nocardioides sp.]|nr:alkaline phosphatase family protein [Nocardioides sp.]HRK48552.1 alkaline phosphatase family protein [Nocardioides sp.]
AAPTSAPPSRPKAHRVRDVLAISVDGLTPRAFDELAPDRIPAFTRLLQEGAVTLNARTAVEQTVTLPNHTGMLTGRRIDPDQGGHGVTWNDEIPGSTVPGPDGDGVESVFDVVHDAGGTTALFAGKTKFATFERSWPDSIDEFEIDGNAGALVDDTIASLTADKRRFTFLHIELPDVLGHATGWLSPAYLVAVQDTDQLLGEILDAVDSTPRLSKRLVVILTADHGGPAGEKQHDAADNAANYTIPFVVWGRGIESTDLYDLNPDYANPGDEQPSYGGAQPIRNADVANLATDVLGLGPVPGSEFDAQQDLVFR